MLSDILSIVPNGNPRYLGGYMRLLSTIQTRMDIVKSRFMQLVSLPRTPGVETLEWMLYNFNRADAKTYDNDDLELYVDMLEPLSSKFKVIFDPMATKSLSRGKFYRAKSGTNPTEVFLNTSVDSPVSKLPFGKGWQEWMNVRAIRHVYHDALELPIDLNSGQAVFDKAPSFAIMSIDIPVLLMKYFKFTQAWARGMPKDIEPIRFLKHEFLGFFDDFVDIWVTQLIYFILTRPNADPKKLAAELNISSFIVDKSVVEVGVKSLQDVFKLIESRNIKFQDFLACQVYPKGTIRDKIKDLEENIILPDSLHYLWLDVLKALPYFQILSAVTDMDKDNPLFQQVMRKAYWIWMRKVKLMKLPNFQFSANVKSFVELSVDLMTAIFETKLDFPLESTTKA